MPFNRAIADYNNAATTNVGPLTIRHRRLQQSPSRIAIANQQQSPSPTTTIALQSLNAATTNVGPRKLKSRHRRLQPLEALGWNRGSPGTASRGSVGPKLFERAARICLQSGTFLLWAEFSRIPAPTSGGWGPVPKAPNIRHTAWRLLAPRSRRSVKLLANSHTLPPIN